MRPSPTALSRWSLKGIRNRQLRLFELRMQQRFQREHPDIDNNPPPSHFETALSIVRERFSMHLDKSNVQPEPHPAYQTNVETFHKGGIPEQEVPIRCRGWWYLPLGQESVHTHEARTSVRTFAHFFAQTRIDAAEVQALEEHATDPETNAPRAVALLISVRGFRDAAVGQAMNSPVPFMVLHLPDPTNAQDACFEGPWRGVVARTVKEDSALDLDFAVGTCLCNSTLRTVLEDRINILWRRDETKPHGWAVGVPDMLWGDERLGNYDPNAHRAGSSFAERLAAREAEKAATRKAEEIALRRRRQHEQEDIDTAFDDAIGGSG
ncbi:hypothetical protein EXIGLDRAFT_834941 [Exidia glandulosa HHB12029]|uniref:Uncharacterized protein n=1 Tax=Exidia glandulosa HHB12029 TaxID=1314781 RepID=A0A166ARN2_EXIGL|nr:hypothetical protein EXIGLDRAFT_834941 [Exidia glandulosa HHB12029]